MRGLEVEKIDPDRGTAMLDLALVVTEPDLKPDAVERR